MVSVLSLQLLHFGAHGLTAVATALLGYWVVARTELSAKRWVGLWLGNFAVWSVLSAASVVVTHHATAFLLFWLWAFFGLTAIYLTYLFPTAYSGRNPLTSRVCQLAGGLYLLLVLLVLTAPFHELYWQSVTFMSAPFPHFAVEYGPGWIAAIIYSFGAVGVLLYYFAELYFRSRNQHRRLVVVLTLGAIIGFVPVVLSVFDLLVPTYEYLPFVGATHALTVGYVAVRFGSANLSSVARNETLDYLVDPYLALDSGFRLVDFNTASSRLIEGLDGGRIGDPLETVFPALANRLTTDGGIDAPDEPVTFAVDGSQRHYMIDISPVSDWRSTRCYAVVLNDVTELEATRRQLEAKNEKLDAFVGTVSHDLRNPLSVIGGRLKLARLDADSEHLDHIAEAHGRMDELIEDLLVLAREGQDITDPQPVDLAVVAEQAWRSVDADAGSFAIETDRTVLADRSRLQQLLENLLRNSVDHSSTGNRAQPGDSVEHSSTSCQRENRADNSVEHGSTSNRTQSGDSLDHGTDSTATDDAEDDDPPLRITLGELADGFYIEDTGPGIPEADRETIFEAGFTTNDGGTGFGLAIVDQIATAHGWNIRATDASGGGARFEITGVESAD